MSLIGRSFLLATAHAFVLLHLGCRPPDPSTKDVQAEYDAATGQLRRLTINTSIDGKPNVVSHMDGTKFVRIEIDRDENGVTDRWEYYGADQKLKKVGISRSNDGLVDAWLYEGPGGQPAKIELSTKRDGKVSRTEFYSRGQLSRAEEDTNGDSRPDKWETYENGTLATVSFDLTESGKPTVTINYREEKP